MNVSAWTSTWVALASMLFYAASNATLRYLCEIHAPIDGTLCLKESVTVFLVLPWIVFRFFQGRYRFLSKRLVGAVFLGALVCEVIGAQSQLWSYAVVGLVVAVPTIQSTQIVFSAIFGKLWLKDAVSRRKGFAIGLLVAAVFVLSAASLVSEPIFSGETSSVSSAGEQTVETTRTERESEPRRKKTYFLGAFAAILAGTAYAFHITIIRYSMQRHWRSHYGSWESVRIRRWIGHDYLRDGDSVTAADESRQNTPGESLPNRGRGRKTYSPFPITLVMILVTGIGTLYYGASVYATRGMQGFIDVSGEYWFWIILAGLTNTIGFFFQIQGLLLASAAKVSLISASQVVILAIVGVVFFHEAVSFLMILGAVMTIIGVFLTSREVE